MGMFEYVKIKEAVGKVQDSVGKIYDAIKTIPKTSGAMNVGEFKEKAIYLGLAEKDITNCVFSIEGRGKLHAAWLAGYLSYTSFQYRWGLKVVIDDEVVFDVQKKSSAESYYDAINTVGFITSDLYLSGVTTAANDTSSSSALQAGRMIPFVTPNGYNHGKMCLAPFSTTGDNACGATATSDIDDFVSGIAQSNKCYMCVIPDKPCTSYTLAGRLSSNGTNISAGSVIPEPLIFNKSVKVYASNKSNSIYTSIVRVAYTLEG